MFYCNNCTLMKHGQIKRLYNKKYGVDSEEVQECLEFSKECVQDDFDILYKEKMYQDRLAYDDENKLSIPMSIQLNAAIKLYYTKKEKIDDSASVEKAAHGLAEFFFCKPLVVSRILVFWILVEGPHLC